MKHQPKQQASNGRSKNNVRGQRTRRSVIYIRSAASPQTDPLAASHVREQYRACRAQAKKLGAIVEAEYSDIDCSGNDPRRQGLIKLLHRLWQRPKIDHVIVLDLARLARNLPDHAAIRLRIDRAQARLVSCKENIDDSPAALLTRGVSNLIAEYVRPEGKFGRGLVDDARRTA